MEENYYNSHRSVMPPAVTNLVAAHCREIRKYAAETTKSLYHREK
jgi:hypothetical protein